MVYVSGSDLVVKTDDGELRHFPNVSDDKTVTVAGKELTVHDLKLGMKLQRTKLMSQAMSLVRKRTARTTAKLPGFPVT